MSHVAIPIGLLAVSVASVTGRSKFIWKIASVKLKCQCLTLPVMLCYCDTFFLLFFAVLVRRSCRRWSDRRNW
jgi:hypothetical protein